MKNFRHYAGNIAHSIFPLIESPFIDREKFEPGISANILVKDDPWLYESLASIKDFVDEMIIIDSSTDRIYQENCKIIEDLGIKEVNHVRKDIDIFNGKLLAQSLSRREWILHWDSDVVALDSGDFSISNLFNFVKGLKTSNRYYEIFFPLILIGTDFSYVREHEYHIEAWIYSNTKKPLFHLEDLKTFKGGKIDRPNFPLYYKKFYLNKPYALHLRDLMPERKLRLKYFQIMWMNPETRSKFSNYEDFFQSNKNEPILFPSNEYKKYEEKLHGKLPGILNKFKGKNYEEISEIKHFDQY